MMSDLAFEITTKYDEISKRVDYMTILDGTSDVKSYKEFEALIGHNEKIRFIALLDCLQTQLEHIFALVSDDKDWYIQGFIADLLSRGGLYDYMREVENGVVNKKTFIND